MAYYPKSQVKTNLYTSGDEYSLTQTPDASSNLTQTPYIGPYYKTSDGKVYTGENPRDPKTSLLYPILLNTGTNTLPTKTEIRIEDTPQLTEEINISVQYTQIPSANSFKKRSIPSFYLTLPTEQDKQNSYFTRYFCKKNNELKYLEISKSTYNQLISQDQSIAYDLYSGVSLQWVIKGEISQVQSINLGNVNRIISQNQWLGFSQYFKSNFGKYYVGA